MLLGRAGLFRILYFVSVLYFLSVLGLPASFAEHTRRWRQSTYEDFLKGTAHGVAVRSDGRLELAPKVTLLADADASYLWSVRLDPKGTLYAAGGSPAKVFRFDSNGKPAVFFDSTDLSAQAIAFDSKGALYVGTSPDGKVYRVSASGEKSVFFDPKTKYIWDLAFSPDGTLYVATGDKGQVFAVAPDGKGELFYSSDEAHIRVLAFDAKGNLIAGTEPSGRILRISRSSSKTSAKDSKDSAAPKTEGFVLYETSRREVTSLEATRRASSQRHHLHRTRHDNHYPRRRSRFRAGSSPATTIRPLSSSSLQQHLPHQPRGRAGRALDFARRCCLCPWIRFRRTPPCRYRQRRRSPRRRWARRLRPSRQVRLRANHRHRPQFLRQSFPVHGKSWKDFFGRPRIRSRRHVRIPLFRRATFLAVGPPRVVESSVGCLRQVFSQFE